MQSSVKKTRHEKGSKKRDSTKSRDEKKSKKTRKEGEVRDSEPSVPTTTTTTTTTTTIPPPPSPVVAPKKKGTKTPVKSANAEKKSPPPKKTIDKKKQKTNGKDAAEKQTAPAREANAEKKTLPVGEALATKKNEITATACSLEAGFGAPRAGPGLTVGGRARVAKGTTFSDLLLTKKEVTRALREYPESSALRSAGHAAISYPRVEARERHRATQVVRLSTAAKAYLRVQGEALLRALLPKAIMLEVWAGRNRLTAGTVQLVVAEDARAQTMARMGANHAPPLGAVWHAHNVRYPSTVGKAVPTTTEDVYATNDLIVDALDGV